jgi:hypothetical protein
MSSLLSLGTPNHRWQPTAYQRICRAAPTDADKLCDWCVHASTRAAIFTDSK